MKATWNNIVIAEAPEEELISIERNWYFPPSAVNKRYLQESSTPYTCPWKGVCQYFNVGDATKWSNDNAWSYPNPMSSAIEKVGQDFSNYVAFWRDVQITE